MSKDEQAEAFVEAMRNAAVWNKRTRVEQAEFDRASSGTFPGGPDLKLGDWVLHPDLGRAVVVGIADGVVHLSSQSGNAIEVPSETTAFIPEAIEEGQTRVFSMSAKPLP